MPAMKRHRDNPVGWFGAVSQEDLRRIVARVRRDGALSIRDIDDDELVDKDHPWASRKPSKRALQMAFFAGLLTIGARAGMVKTYELTDRHFGWEKRPRPATERADPRLPPRPRPARPGHRQPRLDLPPRRRPQAGDSAGDRGPGAAASARAGRGGGRRQDHALDAARDRRHPARAGPRPRPPPLPFDPLVIQRKRLSLLFGYDHRFEAYVPKEKRVLGYFALPVLAGDRIVAAIDLKTDRAAGKLLIQQWTWVGEGNEPAHKPPIEEALHRFERFQLGA